MNDTETTPIPATEAPEFSGSATYSPEDNKLRLYVGRVPRDEYLKLRAEGWTATPKQDCNFVAHWTPERRDTALEYAGVIGDEDQSPADRAADRAERFAGYREKRTDEATNHADRYDAGPSVHGFQSQARAERSARRHDRIAGRACDAWSKAEYWQSRTAGVISHALHVSSPSVRMGRIKEIEAAIRKCEKSRAEYVETREKWLAIAAETNTETQNRAALIMAGGASDYWSKYQHPRQADKKDSLWDLLHADRCNGDAITGAEAAALFLSKHGELAPEGDWLTHYRLRLAYENQMLEAQGGRAAFVEMVPGGWILGGRRLGNQERQIVKVNKSPATGRVVSVLVRDNQPSAVDHYGNAYPEGITKVLSHTVEVERMDPDAYRAPTAEELAAFEADKKARKAAAPKVPPIVFVNPTDADAERLQAIWNKGLRQPETVARITQAQYSASDRCETREIVGGGERATRYSLMRSRELPTAAKVRAFGYRVVILTDKPQKPFPASVWHDPRPELIEELARDFEALEAATRSGRLPEGGTPERELLEQAAMCGLVYISSQCQFGFSDAGHVRAKAQRNAAPAFALES